MTPFSGFSKLSARARAFFKGSRGSHDWEHTKRVLTLALRLARDEKADRKIIGAAALLHDIGRPQEDASHGRMDHARIGARLAPGILQTLDFSPTEILAVSHCIAAHRFRNCIHPRTLEAKVLFDADKLDAIGAVGIGRAFLFAGEVGARLHNPHMEISKTRAYTREDTAFREFQVKLRHLYRQMRTASGKRLARPRHNFMAAFFRQLNREAAGLG